MYIFLIFANTLDSKYYIVILEATKVEMKRIWDLGGSFERERERERESAVSREQSKGFLKRHFKLQHIQSMYCREASVLCVPDEPNQQN